MQTIIVKLSPEKLTNPDLDLRYDIPETLEKATDGAISDNGYDYLSDGSIGVWLSTENAQQSYPRVVEVFRKQKFLDNDLSQSAEIFISEKDTDSIENCIKVFPTE